MTGEPWLYVAFALLVVLHVLSLIGFALRRRRRLGRAAAGTDAALEGRDDRNVGGTDRTVGCPSCGAANEKGYRFCRACVAEIPRADDRVLAGGTSRARNLQ